MKKRTKQKTPYFVIGGILILILIAGGIYLYLDRQSSFHDELEPVASLVTEQVQYEREFTTKGYTLDNANVVLDPYHISPLTALIMFETEESVAPTVTVEGKDKWTTYTHTFQEGTEHYLSVYGLYAGVVNHVTVTVGDESKTFELETEELPDDFILPTRVEADKENLDNQLYFFTPSSSGYTCAYDVNGDVRWYLTNYALWKIDRLENGHLLVSTERLVNPPYYMTGLYEMDLLGKIYTEFSLEGGYHHDYFELPSGNLLVASNDFNNDDGTVEDVIVELDRNTGKIVKEYHLNKILNMEDGKSENWISYDWFHNNSVWYDKKTNSITLSGRHQDAVINIDYNSGQLNWIIGDSTNWSEEYQKYFFTPIGDDFEWQWSQHAAMITPEGHVFILDNGNNKSKLKDEYVDASDSYTRGVMYKINTEDMTIEQVWEYGKERGSDFYSPYISDVDYIDKNHYIVHSGGIVYVDGKNSNQPAGFSKNAKLKSDTVELIDDEVVFELVLPTNNYRVEKMSLYIEDEKFEVGEAKRIGTLGKTEVTDEKWTPFLTAKKIDDEYQKHDISIIDEQDRLVVKGQFKRTDDVNIILYQNMKSKYYHVTVSKKPYTALCVDVFTEEETKNGISVTKYMNQKGLSGKYSIYIEINDKLYNTQQFIEF